MYVPLWCKTNFSFLEGASHPEELVETAARLGLPAIAVTDRNGVYGMVRAFDAARQSKVKLITGSQVSIDDGSSVRPPGPGQGGVWQPVPPRLPRSPQESQGDVLRLVERGGGERPRARRALAQRSARILRCAEPGLGTLKEAFGDRLYAVVGAASMGR